MLQLETITEVSRTFQYDYIYIDAIFLAAWVLLLLRYKKWSALKAGIICGALVYAIDALIWFHVPAGPLHPPGTFVREYFIGGQRVPHPATGMLGLRKFGADFMMTWSYSMFAFGYLWIVFEEYREGTIKKNAAQLALFTAVFFASWMSTPFVSALVPIDTTTVYAVRYMDSQLVAWLVNVAVGYAVLAILTVNSRVGKKEPKALLLSLALGIVISFFMEFPLFVSGIRPIAPMLLIYETFFLFNQGAPYLFIISERLLPWLKRKLASRKAGLGQAPPATGEQ